MTANEILEELRPLGADSYKKVIARHGVKEPFFGVKIEHLKKIQKRLKKDYQLALDLYDTGNYDAMYLAGLIADDKKMTKKDLNRWVAQAYCPTLSEYTVPWVAAEGTLGTEIGMEWIKAKKEGTAAAGWSTIAGVAALKDDKDLDLKALKQLLLDVPRTINDQPNRARIAIGRFVIAIGSSVSSLTETAMTVGDAISGIEVDMGDTACKLPNVREYIEKVRARGSIGKKKKTVKC